MKILTLVLGLLFIASGILIFVKKNYKFWSGLYNTKLVEVSGLRKNLLAIGIISLGLIIVIIGLVILNRS